jgi:thiopurine S-methyltransferase
MEPHFWHARWESGQIGWHIEDVNPLLVSHWPRLAAEPGATVFVPLCGKSRDLAWLAGQGHRVLGVEINELAVRSFFDEQGLRPWVREEGAFVRYGAGEIEILCGDVFELGVGELAQARYVYDRAALIAFPPEMRSRYAAHLRAHLAAQVDMLLITIEYDQATMAGPPFSVTPSEITALYGDELALHCLDDFEGLASEHLRARGLERLHERVTRLHRGRPR